jgi:hypothetical protein
MRKFLIVLTMLAAGCAVPPVAPPPPAAEAPAPAPTGPYQGYEVMASRIAIRVYPDGPLAQHGHNHLITSERLTGTVQLREPRTDSRFTLELPLESLVVDDPAARAAAGPDFAKEVPPADREATRRNLLGKEVLDAARQPVLRLTAESLQGGPADYRARVRVALRGEERLIDVPLSLQQEDGQLQIRASFELHHADLGLTPFVAALGALRVRDAFQVDCRLDARRRD